MAKKKEKALYVDITSHEITGGENSYSPEPYEGYDHNEIVIERYNVAYFAEEGRGYESHKVGSWRNDSNCLDPEVDWEKLPDGMIYLAVSRHGDGGTFGRTDGEFTIEYASVDGNGVSDWVEKNYQKIKGQYSGYFETFEGVEVVMVAFSEDPSSVPKKTWFSG